MYLVGALTQILGDFGLSLVSVEGGPFFEAPCSCCWTVQVSWARGIVRYWNHDLVIIQRGFHNGASVEVHLDIDEC